MGNCRFFNTCPQASGSSYTCHHEKDAKEYCGVYKLMKIRQRYDPRGHTSNG